jgi:hypothetical protein
MNNKRKMKKQKKKQTKKRKQRINAHDDAGEKNEPSYTVGRNAN